VVIDPAADLRMVHQDILLHAKGSKVLRGMGLLEEILRAVAAEPRVAVDRAAPGR
jgi:hypothetical protein